MKKSKKKKKIKKECNIINTNRKYNDIIKEEKRKKNKNERIRKESNQNGKRERKKAKRKERKGSEQLNQETELRKNIYKTKKMNEHDPWFPVVPILILYKIYGLYNIM